MTEQPPRSILLVCLGNICRSPLAEGLLRDALAVHGLQSDILIDSAGTGGWHAGAAPDRRSVEIARKHGIDISGLRARQVVPGDFQRFDLVLGMDGWNVADLRRSGPGGRIRLFMEYTLGREEDVPDPYHGEAEDFALTYRMIREASDALAARWAGRAASPPASGHASSTR